MGADIHWITERKHRDGKWEAVLSKPSFRSSGGDNWYRDPAISNSPIEHFGDRDYLWFGILSEVRTDPMEEFGLLAHEGLPEDASDHTCDNLEPDGDLHSQGWFTVETLKNAVQQINSSSEMKEAYEEELETIERHLRYIDQMLLNESADHDLANINTIIFGREYSSDQSVRFPDMVNESNHAALARRERGKGLLPIGPDTFRFCIAYDN